MAIDSPPLLKSVHFSLISLEVSAERARGSRVVVQVNVPATPEKARQRAAKSLVASEYDSEHDSDSGSVTDGDDFLNEDEIVDLRDKPDVEISAEDLLAVLGGTEAYLSDEGYLSTFKPGDRVRGKFATHMRQGKQKIIGAGKWYDAVVQNVYYVQPDFVCFPVGAHPEIALNYYGFAYDLLYEDGDTDVCLPEFAVKPRNVPKVPKV